MCVYVQGVVCGYGRVIVQLYLRPRDHGGAGLGSSRTLPRDMSGDQDGFSIVTWPRVFRSALDSGRAEVLQQSLRDKPKAERMLIMRMLRQLRGLGNQDPVFVGQIITGILCVRSTCRAA